MSENYMISNYIDFECRAYPNGPKLIHVSSQHDNLEKDLEMTNPVRFHAHKFTEIMLITQGAANFIYNTKKVKVFKGDMIIINPNILHIETWDSEFTFYTIGVFNLNMPAGNKHFVHQTGELLDTYRFYFHTLMEEIRMKAYDYQKAMQNAFSNVCILLSRDIADIRPGENLAGGQKTPQPTVSLAKEFIEANYSQDITLKLLCSITYLSPQHFIRQFKVLTGHSPHQYLLRVRIQAAASNLLQRDNSIRQLGEELGFNDTHTFILAFKKLVGLTPQQFRDKFQFSPAEGMKLADFMKFRNDVFQIDSFKK